MLDKQHSEILETALTGFRSKHLAATKAEEEKFTAELTEKLLARQKAKEDFQKELELSLAEQVAMSMKANEVQEGIANLGAEIFYSPAYSTPLVNELKKTLDQAPLKAVSRNPDQNSEVLSKELKTIPRKLKNSRDVVFVLGLDKDENNRPKLVASFSVRNPSDAKDLDTGVIVAGERFLAGQTVSVPLFPSEIKGGFSQGDKVQTLFQKWIKEYHRPSVGL